MRATARMISLGCILATWACGMETIVHDVDERQANLVLELLADSQIDGDKGMRDTGRQIFYSISVPSKSRLKAIRLLNRHELPQRQDQGYNEVFKESGLIPTSTEEHAKRMAAVEGEIQRQLKLVDGILDVQVQLVMPEESALRTTQDTVPPTTASVTIKYLPSATGTKPLSEPQVQALVAAAVEKLTPDNVVVVMTPGGRLSDRGGLAAETTMMRSGGWGRLTNKHLTGLAMAVIVLILLLSLGVAFAQMRLRTVRMRLMRLQTEIAKARRRPSDDIQPVS